MMSCDLEGSRGMTASGGVKRSADVAAPTPIEVFVMFRTDFREILMAEPRFCTRVPQPFTMHIRDHERRLFEHNMLDLRHRLHAERDRDLAAPARAGDARIDSC